MPDEYTMGDLARQDIYPDETLMQPPPEIPASSGEEYAGLGGDPRALATGIKNWWTNQPSWMQKVGDVTARDTAAYQSGGAPAVIGQLADTSAEQDLLGGFGGNTKSVTGKVVPGALAALGDYHPPFYSAVEQAVAGAKQTTAPGQQWAGFLRNQPGVKPEELSTLKLGDLFDQTGAVTKQDLLDHIAANKVNVGEVVKGEGPKFEFGTPEEQSAATQRFQTARQAINNMPANEIGTHEWNVASAELGAAEAAMRDVVPGWGRAPDSTVSPTKFSQYTLPGGENYRETLLTLPTEKRVPSPDEIENLAKTRYEGFHRKENDPPWERIAPDVQRLYREQANDKIITAESPAAFRSSHYDEPNILAHVRTNDRVIDGKKTLFVEEVQSDWHQKGKREGYATGEKFSNEEREELSKLRERTRQIERQVSQSNDFSNEPLKAEYAQLWEKMNELDAKRLRLAEGNRVPDAPFKTTWPDLAMKRVIRQAAEGGYDKVAWTPGSVQAERYDLSKSISRLSLSKFPDGKLYLQAFDKEPKEVIARHVTEAELPDLIGKEAADKLIKQEPQRSKLLPQVSTGDLKVTESELDRTFTTPDGRYLRIGKGAFADEMEARESAARHLNSEAGKINERRIMKGQERRELSGLDLKVGGEGMKGFYDQILPAAVNKLVKKHGARVDASTLDVPMIRKGGSVGDTPTAVHSLDITPSLRAAAMKGFPLFTAGGIAATGMMGDLAKQDDYQ